METSQQGLDASLVTKFPNRATGDYNEGILPMSVKCMPTSSHFIVQGLFSKDKMLHL